MKAKVLKKNTVFIELEEWEARDLSSVLARLGQKRAISRSEFSMREKVTCRKLINELRIF